MLERQIDQWERRAVMRNEQRVREEQGRVFAPDQSLPRQATTMHAFAQADAQTPRGRFSAVEAQTVVGADPLPNYPPAAAHQHDPCGQEPPLGYAIDELEPSFPSVQVPDGPADAPSTPLGQRAGSSLSSQPNSASADATSSSDDYDDERRDAGLGQRFRRRV
jgi:hypothetical protein